MKYQLVAFISFILVKISSPSVIPTNVDKGLEENDLRSTSNNDKLIFTHVVSKNHHIRIFDLQKLSIDFNSSFVMVKETSSVHFLLIRTAMKISGPTVSDN